MDPLQNTEFLKELSQKLSRLHALDDLGKHANLDKICEGRSEWKG